MHETLATARRLRRHPLFRKARHEVTRQLDRVDHRVVRVARVRVESFERHVHRVGAEGLRIQHAKRRRVDRVGAVRVKLLDVEVRRAAAYFLVRRERHAKIPVLDLRMIQKVLHRRHDRSHARLVVCTQKRRARCRHDVVANLLAQFRRLRKLDDRVLSVRQYNVLTLIILVNDRLHARTADLG